MIPPLELLLHRQELVKGLFFKFKNILIKKTDCNQLKIISINHPLTTTQH